MKLWRELWTKIINRHFKRTDWTSKVGRQQRSCFQHFEVQYIPRETRCRLILQVKLFPFRSIPSRMKSRSVGNIWTEVLRWLRQKGFASDLCIYAQFDGGTFHRIFNSFMPLHPEYTNIVFPFALWRILIHWDVSMCEPRNQFGTRIQVSWRASQVTEALPIRVKICEIELPGYVTSASKSIFLQPILYKRIFSIQKKVWSLSPVYLLAIRSDFCILNRSGI